MTCYHPLPAWRTNSVNPETGKRRITFDPNQWSRRPEDALVVPCGQCIGCRLKYSREWAARCVFEAKQHSANSFITLTYSPENLPSDGSLHYEHFQLFMKRLRKAVDLEYGVKVRFFMCGEYGDQFSRPHYHAILFGFDFPDKQLWSFRHNNRLYRSPLLERLWPFGFSSIGEVTFESAAYVARYCTKKIKGKAAESYYKDREPEFSNCSRKPGIAREWIEEYLDDVYTPDRLIISADIMMNPPRYFDKILELTDGERFESIKAERVRKLKEAKALSGDGDVNRVKLAVSEKIKQSKFKRLVRVMENDS